MSPAQPHLAAAPAPARFLAVRGGPGGGQRALRGGLSRVSRTATSTSRRLSPRRATTRCYLLHGMPGIAVGVPLAGTPTSPTVADARDRPPARPPVHRRPPRGRARPPLQRRMGRPLGAPPSSSGIVPWVDSRSPDESGRAGPRAGRPLRRRLRAQMDIGLRSPHLFGGDRVVVGYFEPLHDGPFKHASRTDSRRTTRRSSRRPRRDAPSPRHKLLRLERTGRTATGSSRPTRLPVRPRAARRRSPGSLLPARESTGRVAGATRHRPALGVCAASLIRPQRAAFSLRRPLARLRGTRRMFCLPPGAERE